MKNAFVNIITSFFALAILISNGHSLGHLSDYDNAISCEFCEVLTDYDQLNLLDGSISFSENESCYVHEELNQLFPYNISQEKIVSPDFIYNKPPPLA